MKPCPIVHGGDCHLRPVYYKGKYDSRHVDDSHPLKRSIGHWEGTVTQYRRRPLEKNSGKITNPKREGKIRNKVANEGMKDASHLY